MKRRSSGLGYYDSGRHKWYFIANIEMSYIKYLIKFIYGKITLTLDWELHPSTITNPA